MHNPPLIHTVTGPLPAAAVRGPALAHEHLALDLDRRGDGGAVLDPEAHGPAVTAELAALREEFGLALVIELTCRGMGRDPRALARISRDTQVAVVAATGWYYEPFHTPELKPARGRTTGRHTGPRDRGRARLHGRPARRARRGRQPR